MNFRRKCLTWDILYAIFPSFFAFSLPLALFSFIPFSIWLLQFSKNLVMNFERLASVRTSNDKKRELIIRIDAYQLSGEMKTEKIGKNRPFSI